MYLGDAVIVPTVFAECSEIPTDDRKGEWKHREQFTWNAYRFREVLPSYLDAKRVEPALLNSAHSIRD
jgi:hypothetical protein